MERIQETKYRDRGSTDPTNPEATPPTAESTAPAPDSYQEILSVIDRIIKETTAPTDTNRFSLINAAVGEIAADS